MSTSLELLLKRDEQLRSARSPWESHWQELRDLVNPDASDFNRKATPGSRRTELILDGTACWALEQLASGLHTFLTSPTDRWFNLDVRDYDAQSDATALEWLERVSDIIYHQYADSRSNTMNALHECYQDLGSFGTSVIYQEWNRKDQHLIFREYPLADCRILENSKGMVDTLYRSCDSWTARQIDQEFPNHTAKKIRDCKDQDKCWTVVHAVFPRADRDASKLTKQNKKFASVYFCKEAMAILDEGGYDEFPYHVPRWTKRAGEVYGRSPGMTCLPDIKLLNAMERVQLKACQKIVDPPLMVPNDGFMLPIETKPSSLIFYEAGMGEQSLIRPLETKGRVDIGEEKMEQKRQHVLRCFYADWISRMKKKERQTATEIMDDRDEMLQMMSPILGRLQSELLGPMLARSYNLLLEANLIPPAPVSLQRRDLRVVYVSPAAKAQVARKGVNIRRFMEELLPLAQVSPDVLDAIDTDKYAQEMAVIQDVSRTILRSPEDITAIRQQKAQAQQMQQLAQTAQPAAAALKDVATAREKGMSL